MLTPEDFSPEKFRIHWSVILVIFAAQLIALIALSVAVANYSSFMTASSAATKVGLSIVDDQSGRPMGSEKMGTFCRSAAPH
jgi:hypothetical protein